MENGAQQQLSSTTLLYSARLCLGLPNAEYKNTVKLKFVAEEEVHLSTYMAQYRLLWVCGLWVVQ